MLCWMVVNRCRISDVEKVSKKIEESKKEIKICWLGIMGQKNKNVRDFFRGPDNEVLGKRNRENHPYTMLDEKTMLPFIKENGKDVKIEFDVVEKNFERVKNYIRFDDYQQLAQYVKNLILQSIIGLQ